MKFWITLQILLHPSQQPWHQKVSKRSIDQNSSENFSMYFFIHNIMYSCSCLKGPNNLPVICQKNKRPLKVLNDSILILNDHSDSFRINVESLRTFRVRGPLFLKQITGRQLLFGSLHVTYIPALVNSTGGFLSISCSPLRKLGL